MLYSKGMRNAPIDALEDRDLMVRVVGGEISAFEAIYDRHSAQVFALAMRVTGRQRAAEEATQDVFLGLWRRAAGYDPDRGTLRTWLLAMVRNRSIDWLRREARYDRVVEIDDVLAERLEAAERTDLEVVTREESRHARQLLLGLPAEQRQVIELAYFRGLTHTEIAVRLDIPLGTVKGRQRLGLAKLRQKLGGRGELVPVA
jgi:RNA polymerase sigma-70 factor (ECF subfamily)